MNAREVLRGAIAKRFYRNQKGLAATVGMKPQQMSRKIRYPESLKLGDLWRLDTVLHFTDEEWLQLKKRP